MSIFNKAGIFKGGRQADGGMRDERGIYRGRVDGNTYYTTGETFSGSKDSNGNLYNADGIWVGKVDEHGDIYDTNGIYLGHTDD